MDPVTEVEFCGLDAVDDVRVVVGTPRVVSLAGAEAMPTAISTTLIGIPMRACFLRSGNRADSQDFPTTKCHRRVRARNALANPTDPPTPSISPSKDTSTKTPRPIQKPVPKRGLVVVVSRSRRFMVPLAMGGPAP
ncbi:hypothetical protein [Aestuariimicrobium sp. T2.26MG-19.2B]|uniref:hypothetical protein n=1 Tax=Aestuariimicrobium sp. T2.26MG-19.2B TaxID=3040679 RepID=UPI00254039BD|nr:hypothetical protein [Aestuariimicrobium sp. T2.26MG-19.2B]